MNVKLTPEQESIINAELRAGRFHTVEEVIGEALHVLQVKERSADPSALDGTSRAAVDNMVEFAGRNRTKLEGITVRELIHEGHRL